jgi:hypothetical protein
MRSLRRFLRCLSSWATTDQNEERLRAEIEEHLALQAAEHIRWFVARRSAASGCIEVWRRGSGLTITLTDITRFVI